MKYYSELTKKYYDNDAECLKAEAEFTATKEAEEAKKKELANQISKEKKELSDAIDVASEALAEAYHDYEEAKKIVAELKEEFNKKAKDILDPAEECVRDAQKAKTDAIMAFTKRFGTYSMLYTGDKAYNEFKLASSWFDNFLNDVFKF